MTRLLGRTWTLGNERSEPPLMVVGLGFSFPFTGKAKRSLQSSKRIFKHVNPHERNLVCSDAITQARPAKLKQTPYQPYTCLA